MTWDPYGQQQPQYQPQQPPSQSPQWQPPRPPRRMRKGAVSALAVGGAVAVAVIVAAVSHGNPPPAGATVTFVTDGSPADVTYGDAGSSAQGAVPMRKTVPLGSPLYYSVNVQLQGDGQASCQILVGTVVVSAETATGGYSIATCEISKDPVTGQWAATTGS